jgi:hypothetical protein
MLRILTIQVIAVSLGSASIGAADWLYHRGRIRQRLHDLWVSATSTAICFPLLIGITAIFLGIGVFSEALIGAIAIMMFLWIYQSLRKVPTDQELEWGALSRYSSRQPVSSDVASFCEDATAEISYLGAPMSPRPPGQQVEDALPR